MLVVDTVLWVNVEKLPSRVQYLYACLLKEGKDIKVRRLLVLSDRLLRWPGSIKVERLFLGCFEDSAAIVFDICCELGWLLQGFLDLHEKQSVQRVLNALTVDAVKKALESLKPIADTLRCVYAVCTFSATWSSKYLNNPTPSGMDPTEFDFQTRLRERSPSCDRLRYVLLESSRSCDWRRSGFPGLMHRSMPVMSKPWRGLFALEEVLGLMLDVASLMRIKEDDAATNGLSQDRFYRILHDRYPPASNSVPNFFRIACSVVSEICYPAELPFVSNSSVRTASDVYRYGTACFAILTASSQSESREVVSKGRWKQLVYGKPEYLVRLIAWCWQSDPTKRPAFSTICSLLQRAMQCLIFPPTLNLTRLSNFLQKKEHSLLNLYLSYVWTRDFSDYVLDSNILDEIVGSLHSDTIEQQHLSSDFMCSRIVQAFVYIKACKSDLSSVKLSAKEDDLEWNGCLIPTLNGELQLGSLIDLEKVFNSQSDDALDSTVFEKHAVVFEALAYDRMLAKIPLLDHEFWIRPLVGQKFPIPRPDPLIVPPSNPPGIRIDHHLLPRLVGFWAGI